LCDWPECEHIEGTTDFPSKPNCFEFQQQNPVKKKYLPHFSSKNSEISFIEFDLCQEFPTTPRTPLILNIGFSFIEKMV
jgi:hypothetical protein